MKILLLDIETSPNLATVWNIFKQYVGVHNLLESSYTLCWSARWLGEDVTYFDSIHRSSRKSMIKRIHKLLDEADAVVHYNGTKFDIPTLNKEFLLHGLTPPSPYKQIDLLKTVRKQFRFPSNKLDYVAKQLKLPYQKKEVDHQLWLDCMNKDHEAWEKMEDYNIGDIEVLEALYYKLRPWITGHANLSVYNETLCCPTCGSHSHQKRGYAYTANRKYQRRRCKDCGTWFREVENLSPKEKFVHV